MLSVQFLRFPLLVQSEVVNRMDLRELVKFSFCSKRAHRAVKSANPTLNNLRCHFYEHSLQVNMVKKIDLYSHDNYRISINPFEADKGNRGPAYPGFDGFQMQDFIGYEETFTTSVVVVTEDQYLEICDRLIGHLRDVFGGSVNMDWHMSPVEPIPQIVKKNFPKVQNLFVYPVGFGSQRLEKRPVSPKEARFVLEEFDVTDILYVEAEIEGGYVYSKGFQQDTICIDYPSWVHFDAIIDSKSEHFELYKVRSLFSGDLNRLLKHWVSNEKMQKLEWLRFKLDSIDGLEFSPDFFDLILEGIENVELDRDPAQEQLMERKITRIDGNTATVSVDEKEFNFFEDWSF